MGLLSQKVGGASLGLIVVSGLLQGCASASSSCEPAGQAATSVSNLLALYPDSGVTLAAGAQSVEFKQDAWGTTSFSGLVAGRMQPSGDVGLWALHYNGDGAFLGPQPINSAAKFASPESFATDLDAVEVVASIANSDAAKAVIACVP